MTPQDIETHAKRIALELAYTAVEDAAQNRIPEAIWGDELLSSDIHDDDFTAIRDQVYDYMMEMYLVLNS